MLVFFFPTDDEEIVETGNGFKAVIPPSLRRRVLFACHGHPMSGHFGISKTAHRTRLLYHWKGLSKEVRKYVRGCQHCQQYKPVQKKPTAGEYTTHNMTAPWETMALDLMGPKPAGKNQTAISEATGHTPLVLNTGRIIPPSWDPRLIGYAGRFDKNNPEEFVTKLIDTIKRAHQSRHLQIQKNYERHRDIHNKKYTDCKFELNDLVWKKTHNLSKADDKYHAGFDKKRDGPWRIIHVHDLVPNIPHYPIEQWEEGQEVATHQANETPSWLDETIPVENNPNYPTIGAAETLRGLDKNERFDWDEQPDSRNQKKSPKRRKRENQPPQGSRTSRRPAKMSSQMEASKQRRT
uniref:Integrase zinc-binding domain-containing protein n=1 Tax=Strigamia maritima TaxID=126957 RepID=T1IGT4_STRMM